MPERPNIILITTDSQGWNLLGECGEGFVDTPNIDALAEGGVCCENTYATAPVCGPSRAGLYTGQYSHAVGSWTNGLSLHQGVDTMGEYLRRAGYRTAYVGKWHLDGNYFGDGVPAAGYEEQYWYDGQNYREDIGEDLWEWYRSGMDSRVAENDIDEIHDRGITREDMWAGNVTDRALAFLESAADGDKPYFLAVNYDEPHEPATCPPPYCDRYRDELYPLPENYESVTDLENNDKPERQRQFAKSYADGTVFMNSLEDAPEAGGIHRPLYFGCAEFVDSEIGRLLDDVDYSETITTFTSDHGHYLGAHGLDLKHFAMYDEVINVPMILRGPTIPEGKRNESLISHVDILPTFLAMAEADTPNELHGESFLEPLRAQDDEHREIALVEYISYTQGRVDGDGLYPVRCLVSADGYKLSLNALDTDELYDLHEDLGETTNYLTHSDYTSIRDQLHDQLLTEMSDTNDSFHGQIWFDRPWRQDEADPAHSG